MTITLSHPSSSSAVDWRNSQSLARQLVHAIALPVDLKSRPLHHYESGRTLVKTGDVVARLPFVMSGRLNAVVHIPGKQGGQIVPIAFGAGEIALVSYLFNHLPSGIDLIAAQASTIQWIPVEEIETELSTIRKAEILWKRSPFCWPLWPSAQLRRSWRCCFALYAL